MRRLVRRVGRALDGTIRVVSLLAIVVFFTLSMAYVAPVNPVKLSFHPLLSATIGNYFSQNWSLFAPSPISANNTLLAKCLDTDSSAGLPSEGDWRDLTTPLAKAFQRNRFSAYDRAARPAGNSMRQFMTGGPELFTWYDSCKKGVDSACKVFEHGITAVRKSIGQTLGTIGSSFCNTRPDADNMRTVALRMRVEQTAPWALRHSPARTPHDIDLGTYPIDHAVVPMTFVTP